MPLYVNGDLRRQGPVEALAAHLHPGVPLPEAKGLMLPFLHSDPVPLTLGTVVTGAMGVLKASAMHYVPEEEMARRYNVCRACPHRVNAAVSGCIACEGAASMAGDVIQWFHRATGKQGAAYAKQFQGEACNVCQCSLQMLIPADLSAISIGERTNPSRPSNCWMKP